MTPWSVTREELENEVDAYRKARLARLTAERGWLTLVNKVWLSEGRHTIGAARDSVIVLPEGHAPARLGTVTVEKGAVRLDVEGDAEVFARGERVRALELRSDAHANPDDVTCGTITLQLLQRGHDFALRVRDAESDARRSFPGVPWYPIDPAFRFVARLSPFAVPKEFTVEDGDGRLQTYRSPGAAHFEKDGQSVTILPFFEGAGEKLFILFSDLTSRDETYGAGRFLYAPAPENGYVLLDFNKAFNPPCAFTPYAVCPLPPEENKLPLRIEAGEKRPRE
jgi:hypothetical protein